MERPDYDANVQYVKEDSSQPLGPALINYIQKVVGKFLYLDRAIDNTTLYALNKITIAIEVASLFMNAQELRGCIHQNLLN